MDFLIQETSVSFLTLLLGGFVLISSFIGFLIWLHNKRIEEYRAIQFRHLLKLQQFSRVSKIATGFMHDVSNPLTAVLLQLEQALKQKGSLSHHQLKDSIKNLQKIRQVIELGREEMKEAKISSTIVLFDELDQIVFSLEPLAKKKKVTVYLDVPQRLRTAQISGSYALFSQVVTPLITNAIEVSPKNSSVIISLSQQSSGYQIIIKDSGNGLPLKVQKNLFTPLQSLGKKHGLGIGLFLSKNLIEQEFSGTIAFSSVVKKGTTCSLFFPINQK